MQAEMIGDVRRFNRTVTERVGALSDRFLGQGRPLGEARVLWEIGLDGCELRELRVRLGLDSGYVSRIMRSLEAAGLVTVVASEADRRARIARLTPAGLQERTILDERSDDLARSFLTPLTEAQQDRLVAAMRDVERLLTAAMVELRPVEPTHPDARRCVEAYLAELDRRSDRPFDHTVSLAVEPHQLRPPAGVQLVAYLRAEPVGCGALKHHERAPSEIKRLWVDESIRGLGVGRRVLRELEARAAAHGAASVRLDTHGTLTEAIALYRTTGYVEVAPFNDEPFADHWFEKAL
jgi:DNA-binding MarR family transcriptional regulator/GNAT superfamily N-acetyltransferase